jgi:hypothetical protein
VLTKFQHFHGVGRSEQWYKCVWNEQAVLTSFKMAIGGVEGRRKVPEVLLFGDLRELAYKAIFKMP